MMSDIVVFFATFFVDVFSMDSGVNNCGILTVDISCSNIVVCIQVGSLGTVMNVGIVVRSGMSVVMGGSMSVVMSGSMCIV